MIDADGTIYLASTDNALYALTAATSLTVTPGAGANGAITPNTAQAVTPGNSLTFTALPGANYTVASWSVDGTTAQTGGNQFTLADITENHTVEVTFMVAPLSALTLSASPASPQPLATTITLTAAATGGMAVTYQFWVYNATTQSWSELRAPSASATCTWTPATDGDYYLSVTAQDSGTNSQASAAAGYAIAGPPLKTVALTTAPSSPQQLNSTITLNRRGEQRDNVNYQFWVYCAATQTWSMLQAFSTTATCAWTPATAGAYFLSVTAQDGITGTEASATAWYTITGLPLQAVSLTTTPLSPQPLNTPVTLTAAATGGTNVLYQFWAYNVTTQCWNELQAPSTSATCLWTPATVSRYNLSVTAQDGATGALVSATAWYTISSLTALTLTTAPPSPQQVNTAVTLTAAATGGTSVQYVFWVYNANTRIWNELQAYSASATCAWTPATAGNYLLIATAQDGGTGRELTAEAWYTISNSPPLTAVTLATTPTSPQPLDSSITLTATATGGNNVLYQFWVYNAATQSWSALQASSTSATCTWTPAMAGSYLLSVTAQDPGTGQQLSNANWFSVTNAQLTAVTLTTAPLSPQPCNTPVTLTAAATGGTNVQYQFWVYNATTASWRELQPPSTSATCTWTPAAAGLYYLSVTAQDSTGAMVYTTAWYTVSSQQSAALTTSPTSFPLAAHAPDIARSPATRCECAPAAWIHHAGSAVRSP